MSIRRDHISAREQNQIEHCMELETSTQWKILDGAICQQIDAFTRASHCLAPTSFYQRFFKRAFDCITALLLIILVLSWLTPLLYVLIKTGSDGPLFFVQPRTGRNGKVFLCFKFRTMRVNDSCDIAQANDSDYRITSIGRFLRRTHIDELPQIINVLFNQMSFVGPRPHMLYHDALFADLLPQYTLRQHVKPGITGLAQASGFYGATPDFFSIAGRTKLDVFYVKHVSAKLDMKILVTTLIHIPYRNTKRPQL
jgi:lipopolysaccharide/colanic/teichoic acid biosynthesis glycosyltransferase